MDWLKKLKKAATAIFAIGLVLFTSHAIAQEIKSSSEANSLISEGALVLYRQNVPKEKGFASFQVVVHNTGLIEFEGYQFVKTLGRAQRHASPEQMTRLREIVKAKRLSSLDESYFLSIERPTHELKIFGDDGIPKNITFSFRAMPLAIFELLAVLENDWGLKHLRCPFMFAGEDQCESEFSPRDAQYRDLQMEKKK